MWGKSESAEILNYIMNIEVDLCLNLNLNKILMEAPLTDYQ